LIFNLLKNNESIVQDISEYFEDLRFLINRFLIYLNCYLKLNQCSKYHFMKVKLLFLSLITIAIFSIAANSTKESEPMDKTTTVSENPPYHEMPAASEKYTNVTVAARMIDGLGYRYYWATEGLREEDLAYKISEDSRAAGETLHHLYQLSITIVNAPLMKANVRPLEIPEMSFKEKRRLTLENFKQASDLLKASKKRDMKNFKLIFQRGDKQSEFPFWNMINGPIADAIYHTGQIVSYRRASGNPINPKVNVFIGKNKQ
jgi:hypothetical protein